VRRLQAFEERDSRQVGNSLTFIRKASSFTEEGGRDDMDTYSRKGKPGENRITCKVELELELVVCTC
jgi:hypothetical protein